VIDKLRALRLTKAAELAEDAIEESHRTSDRWVFRSYRAAV
jgi:hypothetical protein